MLRYHRLGCMLLVGILTGGVSLTAAATDIYVYQRSDGSRLITDHRHHEPGYRLIKVYRADSGYPEPVRRRSIRPMGSQFDTLIHDTARHTSLDPALLKAVMQVESAFDKYALSSKGASGLMQLMPATASRYGVASVFDPAENVLAGARYLRDLLDLFDGDTRLALAGYNAGENAVARYGGIPPYAETRDYVTKVMRLYARYRKATCQQGNGGDCGQRSNGERMLTVAKP